MVYDTNHALVDTLKWHQNEIEQAHLIFLALIRLKLYKQ